MGSNDLILSVDIGTSAIKAVLFDVDTRPVAIVRQPYPGLALKERWSEQEPETVFKAVAAAMREAIGLLPQGKNLQGICFSAQIYSVLAVDMTGVPITNSLTWFDTRSAQIAEALRQDPAAIDIHLRTGCPLDAIFPLSKICWLKQNIALPDQVKFISIKEYVISRLIECYIVDFSTASSTGFFDIRNKKWDEEALVLMGISPSQLSEPVSPREIYIDWNPDICAYLGITPETPLIIGGADGPLASLGVGAHRPNSLAVNIGASAAARMMIDNPVIDPEGRLWTFTVDENLWVIGGIVSSGGFVYEWFLKNFLSNVNEEWDGKFSQQIYTRAEKLAEGSPPGAEGLIFVPYLGGEQCPAWDPYTKGVFSGLDFRHSRGHFTRAVLEGIARSIYRVAECIRLTLDVHFERVYVTGGLGASPVWAQIAADMLGCTIVVPESVEGSARGAAMLAWIALGKRSNYEDFPPLDKSYVNSRDDVHALYEWQYPTFLKLIDSVKPLQPIM